MFQSVRLFVEREVISTAQALKALVYAFYNPATALVAEARGVALGGGIVLLAGLITAIILLSGCGDQERFSVAPSCSIAQTATGALVTCTDGSQASLTNGQDLESAEEELSDTPCEVTGNVGGFIIDCASPGTVVIAVPEDDGPKISHPDKKHNKHNKHKHN